MAVYGVATNNPFALLGEEDEEETQQLQDAPPERPKTDSSPARGKSARGRGTGRGGRGRDVPSGEAVQEGDVGRDAMKVSQPHRVSRPRGRAPPGKGKRMYDRRDGTGRGHEFEKRHGGGKGNWGVSGEVEFPPEQQAVGWEMPEETSQELPTQDGEVEAETEGAAEAGEPEKKEEVKPEEKPKFTLAEYEEMMKDKPTLLTPVKKEMPVVDKKQFDGMAVLKKTEEESGFEGLEVERRAKKKERKEKEVETVEVAFWVGDRGRGRGRGGRGRGRGRSRDFDRDGEGFQRWSNGAGGPSDLARADSTGHTPRFRGRGRGRGRSRGSYGDQVARVSGVQGDVVYENAFPSLTG